MTHNFIPELRDLFSGRNSGSPFIAGAGGEVVTWGTFKEDVCHAVPPMQAFEGTNIGLYFGDIYDFAVAFMAVLHAGKIPVLLPHLKPDFLASLGGMVDGLLTTEQASGSDLPRVGHLADPTGQTRLPEMSSEAGLCLCTSGSTGNPELMEKPLACLEAEIAVHHTIFDADPGTRIAGSVSHQHIYGLLFRLLRPMMCGQVIWRPIVRFPEDIMGLPKGCLFVSSPAFLKRAIAVPGFMPGAARLATCFSSGGPLPQEVARAMHLEAGQAPIEIYGSTETGGVAWRHFMTESEYGPWTLMQGIEATVSDGRLALRSPFIPGETPYVTNDRVQLSGSDSFELMGRIDRIAKVEEKRVSLTALERCLADDDLVDEVAVMLLSGDTRTRLGAVLVPTTNGWSFLVANGRKAFVSRLSHRIAATVEDIAVPRRWRFVKTMPRNSQGKTLAADLQALFHPCDTLRPGPVTTVVEGDTAVVELLVDANIFYFQGHFPGEPILPGVAQLGWAAQFADELFAVGSGYSRIEALKFQQVITPDMLVTLTLTHNPDKRNVAFAFTSDSGRHSSGRLVYGGDDGR